MSKKFEHADQVAAQAAVPARRRYRGATMAAALVATAALAGTAAVPASAAGSTAGAASTVQGSDRLAQPNAVRSYEITVRTGNFPYAGTDGDVWVWVQGSAASSGWKYLDTWEDNFEQGKTDYFNIRMVDVGTVQRAWIYFRPLGGNAAWYLETVSIEGTTFELNQWLTTEGSRELRK